MTRGQANAGTTTPGQHMAAASVAGSSLRALGRPHVGPSDMQGRSRFNTKSRSKTRPTVSREIRALTRTLRDLRTRRTSASVCAHEHLLRLTWYFSTHHPALGTHKVSPLLRKTSKRAVAEVAEGGLYAPLGSGSKLPPNEGSNH